MAGWSDFKRSRLPCFGLQEVTQGITPFTGRRVDVHGRRPPLTPLHLPSQGQLQLHHQSGDRSPEAFADNSEIINPNLRQGRDQDQNQNQNQDQQRRGNICLQNPRANHNNIQSHQRGRNCLGFNAVQCPNQVENLRSISNDNINVSGSEYSISPASPLISSGFEPLASRLLAFQLLSEQTSVSPPSFNHRQRNYNHHCHNHNHRRYHQTHHPHHRSHRNINTTRDNKSDESSSDNSSDLEFKDDLSSSAVLLQSPDQEFGDNNHSQFQNSFSRRYSHSHTNSLCNTSHNDGDVEMAYTNSPPISPSGLFPNSQYSASSIFSISHQDASTVVRNQDRNDEGLGHYLIQIRLRPLFSDDIISGACLRKLPRLINGIPLGAGFLSRDQLSGIKWRMIEGSHSPLAFISSAIKQDEAEESKTCFKESLIKQSQAVFGDVTVKASIMLTKCIQNDDDFVINDIAVNYGEGLQFRD